MSLNNLSLPANLVTELYRNSLISEVPVFSERKTKPGEEVRFLGENRKHILVIVNDPESVHIADEQLSFLTKLLASTDHSLADVAIINLNQLKTVNPAGITQQLKSRLVFLFGVEPTDFGLPVSFPQFQVQALNKVQYLFSPSLNELEKDKLSKSKLWVCLKRIFNIS